MSSPYLSRTAAAYRDAAAALDAERVARWERLLRHTEHELAALNGLEAEARELRREAALVEADVTAIGREEREMVRRAA